MQLAVLSTMTIGEVQEAFHAEFPYLKIAFFSREHKEHKGSSAKFLISDHNMSLSETPGFKNDGVLYIEPTMHTWQVEKMFEDEVGLHVQVFRKSGAIWLETSKTDDLTLEQQTAKAMDYEAFLRPIEDPLDYREQE